MFGDVFPNATLANHSITSPVDQDYNCIAWSLRVNDRWIWPDDDEQYGWPPSITREPTLEAFTSFYNLVGFEACPSGNHEPGWEKIAIYMLDGVVEHAARSLADGRWASKLGDQVDIEHATPDVLHGPCYGYTRAFFKRQANTDPKVPELHPPKKAPPLIIGL